MSGVTRDDDHDRAERLPATVAGRVLVIDYGSREAAAAAIAGPLCFVGSHRHLESENLRLRAAVAEGDRRIEALRELAHPTLNGYCPKCSGDCLIGFATPTPARTALEGPK